MWRFPREELSYGGLSKIQKAAKTERAAYSFDLVAREWFTKYAPKWAETHSNKIIRRLESDIFTWLGARPIADISAPDVLACLRRIEGRGALDTAHRAQQNCGQVFRYGLATGRCQRDRTADLRRALPPAGHEHFAAIAEPAAVSELLRAVDGFKCTY